MIRIRFFTEASFNSGLGHLIRTLTVARQFIEDERFQNENIKILVNAKMDIDRFIVGLEKIINISDSDQIFIDEIQKNKDCINIFDILTCSEIFKNQFSYLKNSKNISLSPVSEINNQIDLIISRGFVQNHKNIKQIFGLEYSVIRKDIKRINPSEYEKLTNDPRQNIGIAMGGSDTENFSKKILQTIKSISIPTTIWLAIGSEYKHNVNDLFVEIKSSKYVDLVVGSVFDDLWIFLEKCKLVILQGGLTTTEAAFRGVPSINIPRFNSQSIVNKKLFDNEAAWLIEKEKIGIINVYIKKLISNELALRNASLRGKELIDGYGASRVKQEILKISSNE